MSLLLKVVYFVEELELLCLVSYAVGYTATRFKADAGGIMGYVQPKGSSRTTDGRRPTTRENDPDRRPPVNMPPPVRIPPPPSPAQIFVTSRQSSDAESKG
jgi:hypothetical protein